MLLAGDIGGTKTNLAVVAAGGGPRKFLAEATFKSAEYSTLEAMIAEFLRDTGSTVTAASLGVAGPVVAGRATTTNLPWLLDEAALSAELSLSRVHLLNDLEAIAYGVTRLEERDLATLYSGKPVRGGAIGIVAPGTGLGEAFLTSTGERYQVHASEGGHTDFGPTDDLQIGLLQYLLKRYEHISYERVCSGIALPGIYAYLKECGHADEPAWLAAKMESSRDPNPVIVETALQNPAGGELCRATLDMFISILASESGNLALKVLATGGLYLGGGIPPRILPLLQGSRFVEIFQRKGRLSAVLNDIPVHVILNPKVALIGAASHGLDTS